jgi:hypothetical protein
VAKARQLTALLNANPNLVVIVPEMVLSYQEVAQKVTLAHNAKYQLDLKGGSGGHMWTKRSYTAPGGKGGHVTAQFNFNANTELAVRTGGEGEGTATYNGSAYARVDNTKYISAKPGGWNGGGSGSAGQKSGNDYFAAGGAGGGSTDVRPWSDSESNTLLTCDEANDPRIAVAAGGGGAAQSPGSGQWYAIPGGNAGERGKTYKMSATSEDVSRAPLPGESDDEKGRNATKGSSCYEGRGGGGGGFKGGDSVHGSQYKGDTSNNIVCSGAGGTNYVRSDRVSDPAPALTVAGQWGNGAATITWISNNN